MRLLLITALVEERRPEATQTQQRPPRHTIGGLWGLPRLCITGRARRATSRVHHCETPDKNKQTKTEVGGSLWAHAAV